MKRKNKNIGGRVQVREITTEINPDVKWKRLKNVKGTIVENKGHEHYYHSCSGGYNYVTKHIIEDCAFKTFAIKLDDGIKDIEGNNIVVVVEYNLKFLDRIEIKRKPITEKQYLNAKKIIERYEKENK
jgi:hypothetical protein